MSEILTKSWDELTNLIGCSNSILLSTHVNPDGDGLGSEIGFNNYLKSLGKDSRIINISETPEIYEIIDPDGEIEIYNESHNEWLNSVDTTILFDIGDYRRINEIYPQIKTSKIVLFDHHSVSKDNPYFLQVLDLGAPATGYMVWKYLQHLHSDGKFNLDIHTANALYAALITDTGSFRYQSTHADAHLMAAHLIESGVKPYEIYKAIYEQRKLSQVRLLSHVIQCLQFTHNDTVIGFIIDNDILLKANATLKDVDGFTEFMRTIQSVEISYMIQCIDKNQHRINFRSSGKYSVNDIAKSLGGGGHIFAAGARVMDMSTKDLVELINKKIDEKIINGN